MPDNTGIIIIGVGNPYRGDDAVGLFIARQLQGQVPANVEVHENFGEVASMMELFEDAQAVILLDAASSGSEAGRIFRFGAAKEKMPVELFRYSTHAFSIPEAVELARALGQLPPTTIVYGVEGKGFETGESMSPEVEASARKVVDLVLEEIQNIRKKNL